MGERFTVNSKFSLEQACHWLAENFDKKKYSTYSVKHGEARSLDQNALFHVWALEYACYLAKINKDTIDKVLRERFMEGMKDKLKREFYKESGRTWLVVDKIDPETGEVRRGWRSSANYLHDEMFEFMTWIQSKAIDDGIILESKGEYKKMQEESLS